MSKLLLVADGGEGWIGGLYYVRNMLYGLLCADTDRELDIEVLVSVENALVFDDFDGFPNVTVRLVNGRELACSSKMRQLLEGKNCCSFIEDVVKNEGFDWVFPVQGFPYKGVENKCVLWIPDFQYLHYPEYFSRMALVWKKALARSAAQGNNTLVLSSRDCERDFRKAFDVVARAQVVIAPFVSYLGRAFDECTPIDVLRKKYALPDSYFFCANQFWKHKNHILVLEAAVRCKKAGQFVNVVFSGREKGNDNGKTFERLKDYVKQNGIEDRVIFTGFISREDQLGLMRNSLAVVQPSKFEGWGTVCEDAKAMGKTIFLSDIAVHHEQMPDGIFFSVDDSRDLATHMLAMKSNKLSSFCAIEDERERLNKRANAYECELLSVFIGRHR